SNMFSPLIPHINYMQNVPHSREHFTDFCYNCTGKDCKETLVCPTVPGIPVDRCSTVEMNAKSCMNRNLCIAPISCCQGDLCNSAVTTGPALALLLLSSTIFTLFL
uniref:UPAR/Ly6 domain-containing protein n=1 Tax=Neogobius melanostomus TaxID=47308 RepID=A0A8C6SBV2_9GOBI